MREPAASPTLDLRHHGKHCASCGQRFSPDAKFCPFDGSMLSVAPAQPPVVDAMVGAHIDGRYEVLRLLGEGGMGQVYLVRHLSLDRRFAMKVLRRDLARDADLAARFIDEARATASIHHPNVVAITDFGRLADGVPYFVMEHLEGETLGRVIKAGGSIPAARAVRILEQVASALGAAHDAGIVHRDLKPDNVFLVGGMRDGASADDVRLVDFGAAKIVGSSRVTRQGVVFGTPHYMSPEQAGGHPVDHRADVYALGVILYEMFTGRVPFEADTYMGVLTQHMFVQPVPPSRIAPRSELGALEALTLRCLAKKPEERFASMLEFAEELGNVSRLPGAPRSGSRFVARGGADGMADRLEPPSLAEMRLAVGAAESTPSRRMSPWVVGISVAVVIGSLAGWLLVASTARRPDETRVAPTATVSPAVLPATAVPSPTPAASVPAEIASAPASAAAAPGVSSAPGPATPARHPPPRPAAPLDDVGDPFAIKR